MLKCYLTLTVVFNIDLIYICFALFVHFKDMYYVLNMEQWNFDMKKGSYFYYFKSNTSVNIKINTLHFYLG